MPDWFIGTQPYHYQLLFCAMPVFKFSKSLVRNRTDQLNILSQYLLTRCASVLTITFWGQVSQHFLPYRKEAHDKRN